MGQSSSSGAKGVGTFTESIRYGTLPKESSIEYEGLFFNYYFETKDEKEELFRPNFSYAISNDPLSGQREHYVAIGLASKTDGEGFYLHGGRPPLNLTIVLDTSGSMNSGFTGTGESKSKLEIAKEALLSLLARLNAKDKFGLVMFDTAARVLQPLKSLEEINLGSLKSTILELKAGGGTSLAAGINSGTSLFQSVLGREDNQKNENRIIYLTDMMPNTGDIDGKTLMEVTAANAKRKLYTTFIGVGVDFNTDLTSQISSIRAANYFSVQTSRQFKKQMDEEFDYMVTPNVFDCAIDLEAPGWTVARVFGSPGYEHPDKGRLMFMDSSFPSLKEGSNMTKGGIVLVKLQRTNTEASTMKLTTTYSDRDGKKYNLVDTLEFPEDKGTEQFENPSIRKAILLVRYVSFFKNFLRDTRAGGSAVSMNSTSGITIPPLLSKKEKESGSLQMKPLSPEWKELFKQFIAHFEEEMKVVEDPTLDKELQQLLTIYNLQEKKPTTQEN